MDPCRVIEAHPRGAEPRALHHTFRERHCGFPLHQHPIVGAPLGGLFVVNPVAARVSLARIQPPDPAR